MNQLVVVLFFCAALLLALIQICLRAIRREAPALFEQLGKPDLFANNNFPQVYRFWRCLYRGALGEHLSARSQVVAWTLRLLTPLYVLAILVLFARSLF